MDVQSPSRQLRQAIIGADAQPLAGATAPSSNVRAAMFSHIFKARWRGEAAAGGGGGGGGKNVVEADQRSFAQVLEGGEVGAVVEFVSRAMTAQLARLIDVDVATINVRQGSIMDLGLDSLVAVELGLEVQPRFSL